MGSARGGSCSACCSSSDSILLVIDPVSAFMADRDSHKDTSVRALLNKIRQFAVEGNYAALLISHFNKPGEKVSSAVHRVMGSLGFVAAARSVYAIVKDHQDSDKKLLLPIKNNLGPDTEGFRYRIKTDHKQKMVPRTAYLEWDKEAVAGTRSLGLVEGINNKIRVLQRRAYGYRDEDFLKLKIVAAFLPPLPRNANINPHTSA